MTWVEEELKYADLGDKRRDERLVTTVNKLSSAPGRSIPQLCETEAEMRATYQFFANRRIKASDILAAHTASTIERVKNHETVLSVQDTTDLDFSKHRKKRNMGYLDKPKAKGMKVHTSRYRSNSKFKIQNSKLRNNLDTISIGILFFLDDDCRYDFN